MTAPTVRTTEKRLGTKAKIRKGRERERKIVRSVLLSAALIAVLFSSYFIYTYIQTQEETKNSTSSALKAAIVDHLSLTYPNETFVQMVTSTLQQAGYAVDYYSGEKTTVDFYRNLATHGYRIVLLRVHSSATASEEKKVPVCFFTSESYSQSKYVSEQLNEQIGMCSYAPFQPPYYFSITPKFIESCMDGRFNNTVIIMMGCEGMCNADMAEAFMGKGARVYMGWNGSVTVGNTDQATAYLLQHMVVQKKTIDQAVTEVMKEVGVDPEDNSILEYCPLEAGNYVVSNG
jgi:hypothetical protein